MELLINEYDQYYDKNKTIGKPSFIDYPISEIDEKLNFQVESKVMKGNFISIGENDMLLSIMEIKE